MFSSVAIVDPDEIPEWDELLEPFSDSTFFHTREWAAILRATYGFSPRYLLLGATRAPRAVLPLMQVDSWLTGRRGVGLPFSDACAPLSLDEEALHAVVAKARDLARVESWRYLEIRGGLERLAGAQASTVFHGHALPLVDDETVLQERLDPAVRRALRKGRDDGVEVEIEHSDAAMAGLQGLLAQTRRRHGVPQQPAAFFRNIHQGMIRPGKGCIVTARREGRAIAAGLFLEHKRKALYKFGGSDQKFQQHRGNNLVMWNAIRHYARRGFESFDFGRTSLANEGLRRFKRSWGSDERAINYFRLDGRTSRWTTVADRSSNRLSPLFRMLPIPLSRVVGAILYRHAA
ncbi:MAG: GNAT family N-acetyltransferase [Opitutaceae bacterium]|nr:GNAT family N-acetyltransferase [Opitutaceae bacterium]